jgi:CRP/FNR family cyclic AMP-dependent transcriptional regulator
MVRAAAVLTLATLDPDRALGPAIGLLEDPSHRVREAAAEASVRIGAASVDPLLAAMARPTARRASLEALAQLDLGDRHEVVRTFFTEHAAEASRDRALAVSVASDGEAADLVRDALLDRARRTGRTALRALSLISADGPSMRAAIDSLDARDGVQVANALETLDSTADPVLVRPLLPLWERSDPGPAGVPNQPLDQILHDPDPFIAMCGELLRIAPRGDDEMAHVHTTMPMMERVLFLRKVPLFDELAPADLLPIAEVAEGRTFTDGELLAVQGEMGDGLHVIVTGSVGVEAAGAEIARRGPGDVVGEMSLITQRPRMASLIAGGDVRTIWISRRAFEGMIHDRPDVAIGVMRVLADRLGER